MTAYYIWDPFVRLFHWSVALLFFINALLLDPDADLHRWIGYTVVGLVSARLLWGFIGGTYARFRNFLPSWTGCLEQVQDMARGAEHAHRGHSPLGALMIFNLLASLLAIGATGYLMTTDMFWGIEWPGELHETCVTWAEVSVGLHVAAVIFETRRTKVKLARAMITGYKDIPNASQEPAP